MLNLFKNIILDMYKTSNQLFLKIFKMLRYNNSLGAAI